MNGAATTIKQFLIGRPRSSRELKHQLLPKWMAMPVFSSDPFSSVAYATEEMMLVLALAGAAAFSLVVPLSLAVGLLLVTVIVSYRQTVRAYPQGGGAYRVARTNLGDLPGLTAASALMIDYVLTVAVSTAAGVAAITSAAPSLADYRLIIAVAVVALVTVANLRGVKESGVLFAVPTYTFILTMLVLVVVGLTRCGFGGCPQAPAIPVPAEAEAATAALSLFLILRAFSSGATALTGVEAISDGVPAFRYPQSHNAATTLGVMGAIAVTLFLGISFLAANTGVTVYEGVERTVTSQIAQAVFGGGPAFYLVQIVTAAILFLAANTAYADFPRLAWFLAGDRFLPRQFRARGDRLVFSNGTLVLAGAACLLLIAFNADVTRLIQLYVVGVFTSFTLSQSGMVRHWLRTRAPGWQRSAVINGTGAAVTGVVLVVVAVTKFTGGAWIVIVAIPAVVLLMYKIHDHYERFSLALRAGVAEPQPARPNHVVVLLDRVDESLARAVAWARAIEPASLQAMAVPVHGQTDIEDRFAELAGDLPLQVFPSGPSGAVVDRFADALAEQAAQHPDAFTTAIVPETLSQSWVDQVRKHRLALRLKAELLGRGEVVVADLTAPSAAGDTLTTSEPVEHHVVVLVSAISQATVRALSYAESMRPTSIRALSVGLEPEGSTRILREWQDWDVQVPLELVDSPFRSLTDSVVDYLREFSPDGRRVVVTCLLPEFVLPHWYQQPLHNQSALQLKGVLLFERGVVTVSVPFPLDDEDLEGDLASASQVSG